MKTITIPDLHGRNNWLQVVNQEADKIIFLGDYVDSFDFTDQEIESNLRAVVKFKLDNPDKVILLLGNHDITYMYGIDYMCSGYRSSQAEVLTKIFNDNSELFQAAYQHEDVLWTHGGVSKRWWDKYKGWLIEHQVGTNYADLLNMALLHENFRPCLFEVGPNSGGIRYDESGPLWVRPNEMIDTQPFDENIHQIVGHTRFPKITRFNKYGDKTYENCSIIYCDCLGTKEQFMIMEVEDGNKV